jgi:hypothetical protein
MCLSLSFDTGELGSSGLGWADAVMLRSKTTSSRPRVAATCLGISPVVRSKFRCEEFRLSRCGLAGLFQSRCAQQGHRRRERLNIAQTKAPLTALGTYGIPYTRSALPPIVPNGGLLSMSRSDEYRRFAAENRFAADGGSYAQERQQSDDKK